MSLYQAFHDAWILDGVRTPMVDYCGAFADANPIDLGIKAARAALRRSGVQGPQIDSVLTGSMAPGGFDQFYLPRHIGLYAGVPVATARRSPMRPPPASAGASPRPAWAAGRAWRC